MSDWSHVYQELKKPRVTLLLLWEEYRKEHCEGYAYSLFCDQYRAYKRTLDATLRQDYKAGELLGRLRGADSPGKGPGERRASLRTCSSSGDRWPERCRALSTHR